MTTNVYAAKRAIIDRLQQLTGPGAPLEDVQVAYAFPGSTLGMVCVYGGFASFDQPEDIDMGVEGTRRLPWENADIGLHIRVKVSPPPSGGIIDSDIRAEKIGEAIGELLANEPDLCGGKSRALLVGGNASYEADDSSVITTLSYRISVGSVVE